MTPSTTTATSIVDPKAGSHDPKRQQQPSGHLAVYMGLRQKFNTAPSQRSPGVPVAMPLSSSLGFNQRLGTTVFEEYTPPSNSYIGRRLIMEQLAAGEGAQAARLAELRQTLEEAPGEFAASARLQNTGSSPDADVLIVSLHACSRPSSTWSSPSGSSKQRPSSNSPAASV